MPDPTAAHRPADPRAHRHARHVALTGDVDDDAALAAAARAGDVDALGQLVDRFRPMVHGMAGGRFLPGGDHDDLVQEGIIGVWHAIRDHDPGRGPFGPFARLCVDRAMWSAVTRANRLRHRVLREAAPIEEWMDVPDLAAGPEGAAVARDGARHLRAVIGAVLSDLERDVLARYAAGESYDAIADALAVHRKRIDNALQRARRKISAHAGDDVVRALPGEARTAA